MKFTYQSKYYLLSIAFCLFLWEVISIKLNDDFLMPRLKQIFIKCFELIREDNFWQIVYSSFSNLVIALVFSIVIALLLAILSYKKECFFHFVMPLMSIIKSVPTVATIIFVLIWSEVDKVPFFVCIIISVPIIYENILNGLKNIDKKLLLLSATYKIEKKEVIKNIYIPSVLYMIQENIPSIVGLAFKVIISGELIAQKTESIGGQLYMGKIYLDASFILAWIIIVVCSNFMIDIVLNSLNSYLLRWKK